MCPVSKTFPGSVTPPLGVPRVARCRTFPLARPHSPPCSPDTELQPSPFSPSPCSAPSGLCQVLTPPSELQPPMSPMGAEFTIVTFGESGPPSLPNFSRLPTALGTHRQISGPAPPSQSGFTSCSGALSAPATAAPSPTAGSLPPLGFCLCGFLFPEFCPAPFPPGENHVSQPQPHRQLLQDVSPFTHAELGLFREASVPEPIFMPGGPSPGRRQGQALTPGPT